MSFQHVTKCCQDLSSNGAIQADTSQDLRKKSLDLENFEVWGSVFRAGPNPRRLGLAPSLPLWALESKPKARAAPSFHQSACPGTSIKNQANTAKCSNGEGVLRYTCFEDRNNIHGHEED